MRAEILSYSRSRGLFAGVALQGATLREDLDANKAVYNQRLTTKEIVRDPKVKPTPGGEKLLALLSKCLPVVPAAFHRKMRWARVTPNAQRVARRPGGATMISAVMNISRTSSSLAARNWIAAGAAVVLAGCGGRPEPPRAPYVPVAQLEALYGPLIAAANHPTHDQHGTGDRVGLFRDGAGTVWGLPLAIDGNGTVLGCAPPTLRDSPVTDVLPAGADIVGATNAPTGWRGGTGKLEVLFRDKGGELRWRAVASGALTAGPVCWAQEPPGPLQRLEYYRLAPAVP